MHNHHNYENRNFSFKLLKLIIVFLRLIKDGKLCKDK